LRLIPPVAAEFPHVVTDPRRFTKPMSMIAALDWLAALLASPEITVIPTGPEDLALTAE
jgi:hypothetical protein